MSLELFANYERTSNNTRFYRLVSSTPHDIIFRLFDAENPNRNLIEEYQAEFSINGSARQPMIDLRTCQQFIRTTECLSSITVFVSSLNPTEYYKAYTLNASYVSSFPNANFVVYPTLRINESNKTITTLNSTNYTQSSGVYFYGEGHTEVINLSSNFSTANWFVGNELSAIENKSSFRLVTNVTNRTATASLTSSPALDKKLSVSLWATNSKITLTGPIFTYDDSTGNKEFYPFFASSFHPSGSASELNNYLRNFIEIKPYPDTEQYTFQTQLSNYPVTLPYDFSVARFLSWIESKPNYFSFLDEPFYATKWKLGATADTKEPNPDWEITTTKLADLTGYSFPLSYFNQNNIDDYLFKCSAGFGTTINTTVSAFKSTIIKLPPYDWLCRTTHQVLEDQKSVAEMPISRIFTSSYYYLTGETIKFFNITKKAFGVDVLSVSLDSEKFANQLYFAANEVCDPVSSIPCSQIARSYDVGATTLTATINFIDTPNNKQYTTKTVLKDFIEIVPFYDQVVDGSYRSADSRPSILTDDPPRLTPNEWVTEDNINSILTKLYNAIEELRSFSKVYSKTNPIIGRLEPTPVGPCIGKYCLDWSWKGRKYKSSNAFTTWLNTKCPQQYEVAWENEPCYLVDENSTCGRNTHWYTPTIEPAEFNNWPCTNDDETCKYTGIARLNNLDMIVLAHKNELRLLNNDYYAAVLTKQNYADKVFKFVNIAGIASTSNDLVVVLDGTLSKVSLFSVDVQTNKFLLYNTWGRYGLSNSQTGFNKPTDIHTDKYNNVWICDTGNECIKKFTINGRYLTTLQSENFVGNAPISLCVDSNDRVHCLASDSKIYVFNANNEFVFSYSLPEGIKGIKINSSFNDEMIYITYHTGVLKYFKNGSFSHYIIKDFPCAQSDVLNNFCNIIQDKNRNVLVTLNDTVIKFIDRMVIEDLSYENYSSFNLWGLNTILIHKEEYIQPWVYLKSFHRLWDNIELFRNSLFYEIEGCKSFANPVYIKEQLKVGQNEIVTNAVINRLAEQLWINLKLIANYFDPSCKN